METNIEQVIYESVKAKKPLWIDFANKGALDKLLKSKKSSLITAKKKMVVYYWETYTCLTTDIMNNVRYNDSGLNKDIKMLLQSALWVAFNEIAADAKANGMILATVGYMTSDVSDVMAVNEGFIKPDFVL